MTRAAFYFDGFNLYHGIKELNRPHLKWLNLYALALRLIPKQTETLVRVVVCTAIKSDDIPKQLRHRAYLKALGNVGVDCLLGHFSKEPRECHSCTNTWMAPTEKQGDVNLAVSIIDDAYQDIFDHCYLVTTDGDQVATINMLKSRFPQKKLTTVAPPYRSPNLIISNKADSVIQLTVSHIEACLFPRLVPGAAGAALRPAEYDPPV